MKFNLFTTILHFNFGISQPPPVSNSAKFHNNLQHLSSQQSLNFILDYNSDNFSIKTRLLGIRSPTIITGKDAELFNQAASLFWQNSVILTGVKLGLIKQKFL